MSSPSRRSTEPAVVTVVVSPADRPVVEVRGCADTHEGAPATPTTPVHLCSIAKTVTAVGVLRLAGRGVLDLDADLRDLVPVDVPGRTGPTLRQLLSHRGGVVDPPGAFEPVSGAVPDVADVLGGRTAAHPGAVRVTVEPGSAFAYSDAGYCLVERAVEVATGRRFADVLHDEVARPLGLTSTGFWAGEPPAPGPRADLVARLAATAASGHHADGRRVAGRRAHYAGLAASGLWSTPDDLAVLVADLLPATRGEDGGVLLGARDGTALCADPGGLGVGLGVFPLGAGGRRRVMTQGWGAGFQSQIWWYPASGAAVAVATNTDPGVPQERSVVGSTVAALARAHGWGRTDEAREAPPAPVSG